MISVAFVVHSRFAVARAALLSSGENSAEVESVGREAIENGVQKTLEEQANTRVRGRSVGR